MTIQEMHIGFWMGIDKTMDYQSPSFLAEQIDYWLNKAQLYIINQLAYPELNQNYGVDNGQKRIDDLRDIIISNYNIFPSSLSGVLQKSTLPDDYFHLLNHTCDIENKTVAGVQSKLDFINFQNNDPFQKPTSIEPLYYILGDGIYYNTLGDFKVDKTTISYIKVPNKMQNGQEYVIPSPNVECSFSQEDMQLKIIDKAVSMVLENIESVRYQTNINEIQNN